MRGVGRPARQPALRAVGPGLRCPAAAAGGPASYSRLRQRLGLGQRERRGPARATRASYGAAAPGEPPVGSGGNIQFIGGAEIDEVTHPSIHQDPLILKTLFAPVAIVALAVQEGYEALQGDPQPVVAAGRPRARAAPGPPRLRRAPTRQSQLEALERQVGRPRSRRPPPASRARRRPRLARAAPRQRPLSIADELASLQRRVPPRGVAPAPAAAPAAGASTPTGVADKVSDRNGDGRPDLWQYRENGVLVRELFDEDGDGRVDHTIRYDPATGQKRCEEEDTNVDGLVDSWVEYQRRRGGAAAPGHERRRPARRLDPLPGRPARPRRGGSQRRRLPRPRRLLPGRASCTARSRTRTATAGPTA